MLRLSPLIYQLFLDAVQRSRLPPYPTSRLKQRIPAAHWAADGGDGLAPPRWPQLGGLRLGCSSSTPSRVELAPGESLLGTSLPAALPANTAGTFPKNLKVLPVDYRKVTSVKISTPLGVESRNHAYGNNYTQLSLFDLTQYSSSDNRIFKSKGRRSQRIPSPLGMGVSNYR